MMESTLSKASFILSLLLCSCWYTPSHASAIEKTSKIEDKIQVLYDISTLDDQSDGENVLTSVPGIALEDRDKFVSLRKRSAEFSAEESDSPPDISLPSIHHFWFPSHDAPPTDLPEVNEFETTRTDDPPEEDERPLDEDNTTENKNQSQTLKNESHQVGAILQDGFHIEAENHDNNAELPSPVLKKQTRGRRDVLSEVEAKRRLTEILKQRREIARQRSQTHAGNSAPQQSNNKRKQTQAGKQNKKPRRKPNQKKQANKRKKTDAKTTATKRAHTTATTSKKSPKPRISTRPPCVTETTDPQSTAQNITVSVIDTTAQVKINRGKQHLSPRNSNNPSSEQSSTFPPFQRRLGTTKPATKRTKTVVSPEGNGPNLSEINITMPKSARSGTMVVVKPVILTNGRKTTMVQRQVSHVQHDWPGSGHNKSRVTFSKWSTWNPCKASDCGAKGTQMRTRTCFGNGLTEADYAICNYDSLVDQRSCSASPCSFSTTETPTASAGPSHLNRSFRWSAWSKCSVTCGAGGKQTRSKICYELTESGSEVPDHCAEETLDSRSCQYSSSCPMWDSWNDWSACSKTCGNGGVSSRDRKCVVERYMSFRQKGRNGRRQPSDLASSSSKRILNEDGNTKQRNATKSPKRPKTSKLGQSRKDNARTQGFVYLKNGQRIFIVDAPRLSQDVSSSDRPVPEFHKNAVREFVDIQLCFQLDGASEEEKGCTQESCPAEWGLWGTWSSCTLTCGMGISKRERSCRGDSPSSTCVGRKSAYRRCFAPPCWGEWSKWGDCSISCGYSPGVKQRTRKCLGTTSFIADYTHCEGEAADKEQCLPDSCPGERWCNWGPYEDCSASCNGGYRRRTRNYRASKCSGPSEDFGRCNIHECPTWSSWSRYSCCTVSCGDGIKSRIRTCLNGEIGEEGCDGETKHTEKCYKRPCEGARNSIFGNLRCGIGSVSNLKTIARLRIFGGTKSAAHDWPWMTSWQHRESQTLPWLHYCGAALIHPRWVISASHCTEESDRFVNNRDPGENWAVVVGMVKLYKDGTRYFLDRIFIHPKYRYKSVTKNDIALLKLRRMVPITNEVMPACMPRGKRPPPGEECYATGWGYASVKSNATLSLSLREAAVPIIRFKQCQTLGDYYRYFLDSSVHMCAGNPVTASSDSCTGDSGGPLVCSRNKRWYLAAVTSFGFADCGTSGHVGIYAPMNTYEPWVRSTLQSFTYETC